MTPGGSFNSGTSATVTAGPASGYIFTGWSGACSGTGSCVVTMNSDQNVTANFVFLQQLLGKVVLSRVFENTEGPSNNCGPFCSSPTRYQQLYAASDLGGSGKIDKISFRLDEIVGGTNTREINLDVRHQKAQLQAILKSAYVLRDDHIELEFRG